MNFYQRFIKGYSKIAALLTVMLWTISKPISVILRRSDEARGGEIWAGDRAVHKEAANSIKSDKYVGSTIPRNLRNFFSCNAQTALNPLQDVFTKVPIYHHFDSTFYIQMETDVSGFAIEGVLSQLFLRSDHMIKHVHDHPPPNLSSKKYQRHLIAFF